MIPGALESALKDTKLGSKLSAEDRQAFRTAFRRYVTEHEEALRVEETFKKALAKRKKEESRYFDTVLKLQAKYGVTTVEEGPEIPPELITTSS